MTEERSKRREFLLLVFIVNCFKKQLPKLLRTAKIIPLISHFEMLLTSKSIEWLPCQQRPFDHPR